MVSKKTQCQAFASSSQNQCSKRPLLGSRYCFLHQSWGINIIGAITMLLVGALLGPPVSDSYRYFFPSQETVAISNLDEKVDGINKSSENRFRVQNQKLDEVLAKQGNERARSEYLSDLKELSELYAEKMVTEPDDSLLKKQKESLKKIEIESQEQANLYELKWSPICHFILTLIDREFSNWKPKGYLAKIEKVDVPVVVAEKQIVQGKCRQYYLKDNSILWMWQESGRVEEGKLQARFQLRFYFDKPKYPTQKLLALDFYAEKSEVRRLSSEFKIEDFISKDSDPMEDKELMDKIAIALRLIVNHAIVHSNVKME